MQWLSVELMKEIKLKKCINCPKEFKQFNSTKIVCSTKCAIEHAKSKPKKVTVQQWEDSTKKNRTTPTAKKKTTKALLQDDINKLARKIDEYFGYECIDLCGKPYGKQIDGCHFKSRGSHANIAFNLHNIHAGRSDCNKWSNTHILGYEKGLVERYGLDYYDMVEGLSKEYPVLKLNEVELKAALKIVRKLNREFQTHLTGHLDGAMMRAYFNDLINIYK